MEIESILELISSNFFKLICHQDPSILMDINGQNILLCPRCSGLHIGFLISFIYFSFEKKKRTKLTGFFPKLLCTLGILIITLEWSLGQFSIITPTMYSRLITGLIAGNSICILALLYRWNYIFKIMQGKSFTWISILGITCLSLILGFSIFQLKNWAILTSILILVVATNLSIVLHSIVLRIFSLVKLNPTKT